MIDHVSIAVRDLEACGRFYEAVLAAIGYGKLVVRPTTIGFGKKYPDFWLNERRAMTPADPDSGTHICLRASSVEAVQAFHAAAMAGGGASDGPPGPSAGIQRRLLRGLRARSRGQQDRSGDVHGGRALIPAHTRPATGGFISFSDSVTLCTAFVSIGRMSSTRSASR